jgi:hypothetical protein
MYAICNCCPECCVSISAHKLFRPLGLKESSLAQSGYLPKINSERGKVIGKQGRIAYAIRNILSAASAKTHKRAVLEILE